MLSIKSKVYVENDWVFRCLFQNWLSCLMAIVRGISYGLSSLFWNFYFSFYRLKSSILTKENLRLKIFSKKLRELNKRIRWFPEIFYYAKITKSKNLEILFLPNQLLYIQNLVYKNFILYWALWIDYIDK